MILAGQLANPNKFHRLYTESEAAANLGHPGIVPFYEVGQHEDQHYFSMLGPRTEAAGLRRMTWPTTSQSNSVRIAARCCLTDSAASGLSARC
jgi:serine/threonine-protein kinase